VRARREINKPESRGDSVQPDINAKDAVSDRVEAVAFAW
jgi:hypothetical protein